jgi:hypothetical protein
MRITRFRDDPTENGNVFAEVWEKSKAIRAFTKASKRTCKCDEEKLQGHQCRETILLSKLQPDDVPALGSTLLEPEVANQVEQQV